MNFLTTIYILFLLTTWHISDYKVNEYWSHDLADGTTLAERVPLDMQNKFKVSEIMYKGTCDMGNAVDKWRKSESHNAILSDKEYDTAVFIMQRTDSEQCIIIGTYAEERDNTK